MMQELQYIVKIMEQRPSDKSKKSCEICGKLFKSQATLDTHTMKYHQQVMSVWQD